MTDQLRVLQLNLSSQEIKISAYLIFLQPLPPRRNQHRKSSMLHLRLFTAPFNLEVRAEHVRQQGRCSPLLPLEVDLSSIEPGTTVTVKWRGKPVFIRRRTEEDIKLANSADLLSLRDPQPDAEQVKNPEWLVVGRRLHSFGLHSITQCRGQFGGWFCPCHSSHYDISGRIRKGPAPFNLEVTTYSFLDENKLSIG